MDRVAVDIKIFFYRQLDFSLAEVVNSEGGNVEGNCVAISCWIVPSTLNLYARKKDTFIGIVML